MTACKHIYNVVVINVKYVTFHACNMSLLKTW